MSTTPTPPRVHAPRRPDAADQTASAPSGSLVLPSTQDTAPVVTGAQVSAVVPGAAAPPAVGVPVPAAPTNGVPATGVPTTAVPTTGVPTTPLLARTGLEAGPLLVLAVLLVVLGVLLTRATAVRAP